MLVRHTSNLYATTMIFNNCRNRDYAPIYGPDAFYDIDLGHRNFKLADELRPGDTCIVASYAANTKTDVKLCWYTLAAKTTDPDEKGALTRVFRGALLKTETMPKAIAVADARYRNIFTVNGAFKFEQAVRSVPKR
jgi:hypothetical protein